MKFSEIGLSEELCSTLEKHNYQSPTEVQSKSVPLILDGKDLIVSSQTGTGKTAAFILPLIQLLNQKESPNREIKALILTPTRELATQTIDFLKKYNSSKDIFYTAVYGGIPIEPQIEKIEKGVNILIATPGRFLDIYERGLLSFKSLDYFVLDEADRLLHMGFQEEINKILSLLPSKRQNLLFSATFTNEIKTLAKIFMNAPEEIEIAAEQKTAANVEQYLYEVDKSKKSPLLIELLRENDWKQVLIFTKTKNEANRISRRLEEKNFEVLTIHGNKSQSVRTRNLAQFQKGKKRILVATDVAARGLDINHLPLVINYNLPHVSENYVHRIGRTGRADKMGLAISLVCSEEFTELVSIERFIQKFIERKTHLAFLPLNKIKSSPSIKDPLIKKPKKKKKKQLKEK